MSSVPAPVFDHVVLRVGDLAQAVAEFTRAGFTVTRGGRHPAWGSENALIVFADQTYLELIAFAPQSGAPAGETRLASMARLRAAGADLLGRRIGSWAAAGTGLVDYALRPADMACSLETLRATGIAVEGPTPGSRERPDGQRVAWQMGVPAGLDLPFLCSDVTPLALRMPDGSARRHANGVQGLAALTLLNPAPAAAARALGILLGQSPAATGDGFALDCAGCRLAVHPPRDTVERGWLEQRGAGPAALVLRGPPRALVDLAHYGLSS